MMSVLTTIVVKIVLPIVFVFLVWVLPLMLLLEYGPNSKNKTFK